MDISYSIQLLKHTLTVAFTFALVHAHVSPNLTINHNSTYVALFITHTHQNTNMHGARTHINMCLYTHNTHSSANVIAKFAYVN